MQEQHTEDWVLLVHREIAWACGIDHTDHQKFQDVGELTKHIANEHENYFPGNESGTIRDYAELSQIQNDPSGSVTNVTESSAPEEELTKHIAGHLRTLALVSLEGTIWQSDEYSTPLDLFKTSSCQRPQEVFEVEKEVSSSIQRILPSLRDNSPEAQVDKESNPQLIRPKMSEQRLTEQNLQQCLGPHGIVQPDSSICIQEFHIWMRSNQSIGIRGRADVPDGDAQFVPAQALEQFFTPDRLKKILKALFEAHPPKSHVSPNTIRSSYLKALAILLEIGEGRYIECFVHYPALRDQNLPFLNRPTNFPVTTGSGSDMFSRFAERQWSYCAPIIKYDIDTRWKSDHILPILCKEKKGEGASAVTYRIKLHATHDELALYNNDPEIPPGNVYALKTFHQYSEQFYEKELQSFSFILDLFKKKGNTGLIGFYGSFRHGRRLNVLLEYADGGTLEDYFKQHSPPSRGVEIIDFWESLSGILKGLHAIHFLVEDDQEAALLLGYHRDVTPKNILCCMADAKNPYRCHFKLGDLGVSHFTKRVLAHDAGGTKTYGAPECYGHDDYFTKTPRTISNKVDIWSVGAIFSEAMEWLVHGYKGLERYRHQRSQEHSDMRDFRDPGCFHNGTALLSSVMAIHEEIQCDLRLSDTITAGSDGVPGILSIAEEMMGRDYQARPEAARADKRIQDMVNLSRINLDRLPAARSRIHPVRAATVRIDPLRKLRMSLLRSDS
ncbi:kinase-like protein [Viridothelium virens]|uniref:Kinase-like protein n=1 Tax=Viridothelium virens TaxID=1048519 RepID=A0A6A6GYR1_VIRVR|nr:kinase-like protein [Viridothelium virens]